MKMFCWFGFHKWKFLKIILSKNISTYAALDTCERCERIRERGYVRGGAT